MKLYNNLVAFSWHNTGHSWSSDYDNIKSLSSQATSPPLVSFGISGFHRFLPLCFQAVSQEKAYVLDYSFVTRVVFTRVVFNWVSKVISQLLWFFTATLCDSLKISDHFLNQSEVKPKPIATYLHVFSRAWRRLHVSALRSDWYIGLSASIVVGQSDYFGFGFTSTAVKRPRGFSFYLVGLKWKHGQGCTK